MRVGDGKERGGRRREELYEERRRGGEGDREDGNKFVVFRRGSRGWRISTRPSQQPASTRDEATTSKTGHVKSILLLHARRYLSQTAIHSQASAMGARPPDCPARLGGRLCEAPLPLLPANADNRRQQGPASSTTDIGLTLKSSLKHYLHGAQSAQDPPDWLQAWTDVRTHARPMAACLTTRPESGLQDALTPKLLV